MYYFVPSGDPHPFIIGIWYLVLVGEIVRASKLGLGSTLTRFTFPTPAHVGSPRAGGGAEIAAAPPPCDRLADTAELSPAVTFAVRTAEVVAAGHSSPPLGRNEGACCGRRGRGRRARGRVRRAVVAP